MKSIGIDEEMHQRIRFLSLVTNKKIYELIKEALNYLEEKYGTSFQSVNKITE